LVLEVLGSKLGHFTGHPEALLGFHQFLQANVETLPRLSNDRFRPNRFQFIIHEPSYYLGIKSLDT
jgi:hypothetical protein